MPWLLRPGYRFLTSVVAAVFAYVLSDGLPQVGSRVVLAWDTGVVVLLGLTGLMMARSDPDETLRRAQKEETSNPLILLATLLSVSGALVAAIFGLPKVEGMSRPLRIFCIWESVTGVVLAWLLLHTMYSLHYAKLYYGPTVVDGFKKGLTFPGDKDRVDYWDFVYYSFTIGMCYQTSDVTVISPQIRRLTIFHATVSYFFALAILGLLLDGFISHLS